MSGRRRPHAARAAAATALLALFVVPTLVGPAAGEETLAQLKARMQKIQAEFDAAAERIGDLEARHHEIEDRMRSIERRKAELEAESAKLEKHVIARANELYRSGGTGMMELLLTAEDLTELSDRAEMLSQASQQDATVFVSLSRSRAELDALTRELRERDAELDQTMDAMEAESRRLQERFEAARDDYAQLRRQIALAAAAAQESVAPAPVVPAPPAPSSGPVEIHDGMTCPIDGPNSFIDSWGYPRSGGRTHEGVDMMAAYGTPVVAITSGSITYAGYGDSAGYWQVLSGDDGHSYWYMHNQENLVAGGHVSAGQQIATVGDTGNAEGTPHLHFEYHPGGGGPVNPYPLVRGLC